MQAVPELSEVRTCTDYSNAIDTSSTTSLDAENIATKVSENSGEEILTMRGTIDLANAE